MKRKARAWTNESVVQFAGDGDPVVEMSRHARGVVTKAMDDGWEGPPFDPTDLAERCGMETAPCEDVPDARILWVRGRYRIEFNPNRPARRVRYSIAHEIAHTFFPDCQEEIRNRELHHRGEGDEWQLEALCNIGAAELLMPVGSLPDLGPAAFGVDQLVDLRDEFHVATEAMAIRLVQLSSHPYAMFCASYRENREVRLRTDYAIPSRGWPESVHVPGVFERASVPAHCDRIDHSWKGVEKWSGTDVHVEAIGIPPYPGSRFPRVIGIVRPSAPGATTRTISYVHGDATEPRGDGPKLVVQVVHDGTANWGGSGFAVAVRRRWPSVQAAFKEWTGGRPSNQFGRVHFCKAGDDVIVASMICQRGYKPARRPLIRYSALRQCLDEVVEYSLEHATSVHMPRIGCGIAGGRWGVIEELISSALVARGLPVTVYDLPGVAPPADDQLSLSW